MAVAKHILLFILGVATASFVASNPSLPDDFSDVDFNDLSDFVRIVGGHDAQLGEYPYYAQMGGCGGSLIAPNVVLTAAHCDYNSSPRPVIVGGYRVNDSTTEGAHLRSCKTWVADPSYQSQNNYDHDFALCLLDEPVYLEGSNTKFELNFNDNVPRVGDSLMAIGLGSLTMGGSISAVKKLQHVSLPYITNEQCNDAYGRAIKDEMLCAGYPQGRMDACQGDSGGPLVDINKKDGITTHTQMGVVSFGYGCALAGYPGVYARVSKAETWIKQKVCNEWKVGASFCSGDVNSPTEAPKRQPLPAPTQAPTSKPTQAPTSKPTQAPATPKTDKCIDDPTFSWGERNLNCSKFLKRNKKKKCKKKLPKGRMRVKDKCRETCASVGLGPCKSN